MKCPFCSAEDTQVIDSRVSDDGDSIRRRRKCAAVSLLKLAKRVRQRDRSYLAPGAGRPVVKAIHRDLPRHIADVEAVERHHLVPGADEIADELAA